MTRKTTGTDHTQPIQGEAVPLSEITDLAAPIETVHDTTRTLKEIAALEAFMNEIVVIRLHTDAREGTLQVETPSVNGMNQPIVRGVATPVKRKYVEALARAKQQSYRQEINQMAPDDIKMIPQTTHYCGFEVLQDKNPRGRAWLDEILAQPA